MLGAAGPPLRASRVNPAGQIAGDLLQKPDRNCNSFDARNKQLCGPKTLESRSAFTIWSGVQMRGESH